VLILYLSTGYLLGIAVCGMLLFAACYGLLHYRRDCRQKSKSPVLANAGLSLVMLLAVVLAAEFGFACFADFSDTFNITNVSRRWLKLHLDDEQNEEGFRDRPFNKFLPSGQKRIVFLGDSFTVGHGIKRMEDRFSDRIAAWLDAKGPGKYVVANMAAPGLEAAQIEAYAKALFISGADVNTIIYVYNLNDIEGYDSLLPDSRINQSLGQINSAGPTFFLFRDTYLLNFLYFRYVQFKYARGTTYFADLAASYRSEAWNGLRAKLAQLRRECKEKNVDFRMVIFPFLNLGKDDIFRDARAKLAEFCKAEKIPLLDLQPVFETHAGEDLVVSRFDAHPNERAHAIAAEAIEKGLLSDLVAPAHP
jgi:lysophospholipase L1-like esterase